MPQLLPNLFHSTYILFFHQETRDSSVDCAKNGRGLTQSGRGHKNLARALRATGYWAHPTFNIFLRPCLTQVKSVKHLGIQLTCDLSWSCHITTIYSKTRRLIGLLYRQFHLCAPETALRLYKTFIRPHLEYASVVWDPYLAKDIQSLEQTQKFALRMCFRDWSCPYQELLVQAETPSLAERRERAKLCHLIKL